MPDFTFLTPPMSLCVNRCNAYCIAILVNQTFSLPLHLVDIIFNTHASVLNHQLTLSSPHSVTEENAFCSQTTNAYAKFSVVLDLLD